MSRPVTDWITLGEAAEIFAASGVSISRATLARWVKAGRLQSIRPGRRIFVRRAQIRHMLKPRASVAARDVQPALFADWDG